MYALIICLLLFHILTLALHARLRGYHCLDPAFGSQSTCRLFSAADTRSVQPFEAVMRSWRSTYSEFLQAGWSVARHIQADLVTNRFLVGCIFFWELEDLSG